MVTFKMWQSEKSAQWYFNITARNGEKVAQSEGYANRQNAAATIDLIRGSAGQSAVEEFRNGRWVKLI